MENNRSPALTFLILSLCIAGVLPAASYGDTSPDSSLLDTAMYGVNKADGRLIRYDFTNSEFSAIGVVTSATGAALLGIEAGAYIPGHQNIYCFWQDPANLSNKLVYVDTESAAGAIVAHDLEGGRITGAVAVPPVAEDITLLDGVDDVVVMPHSDAYLTGNGTIMLRFNAHNLSGTRCLFSKDSCGYDTGGHVQIYLECSRLKVRLQSASASYFVATDTVVEPDSWHRVALTFGSEGMKLYLDGVEVGCNAYTGGLGATSGGAGNHEPITLGASQWASGNLIANNLQYYFAGEIGGLQILDRALSASEVASPASNSDAQWSVFAVQLAEVSPPVEISGVINLNPNNNPRREFQLADATTGLQITRDNLHEDSPVDGDGVYYTGAATMIRVKPKGNGNQNSLMIDGEIFPLHNSNTYVFNGQMQVELYNDHIDSNGKAMGHWWIRITSGTIIQDDDVTLPDRLVQVDHQTGVVTEVMALDRGYDSLASRDGQVFYATCGDELYRIDALNETETLVGTTARPETLGLEFCASALWGFEIVGDTLVPLEVTSGAVLGSKTVSATDLGTIVFVTTPSDPINIPDAFD